ncbi:MAG: TonB-dependent receptor [Bacteroidales bacterium]|nr:TonB-dependent receptor [Bacteroidales bacterium]
MRISHKKKSNVELYFNKWSRKKNSAFLSLNKIIKISVLTISYFMLNAFTTFAQTDTIKIDEIKVSAYRSPILFSEASRTITIINKNEISSSPASSFSEILKMNTNVDIRERGVYGTQSDINLRGGSFSQNLILINGIRFNDSQTGHFQLNLPIEINDIERIEILKGSGSRVFGNNAFSGAINIITSNENTQNLKLSLFTGENQLFGGYISSNFSIKNYSNYISISKKISDGYKENTDFDISNIFYSGNLKFNSSSIQFQTGYLDKSFGANSFYTPVYPNQFEQNKTTFANLKFSLDKKIKSSYSAYWRKNYDRFELFRDNPAPWYTGHNYHVTNTYGASINTNISSKLGNSSIGIDYSIEKILSNKLGEELSEQISIPNEDNLYYTHGKSRENTSIFFEHNFKLEKLSISTGIMLNYNSMYNWQYYPGIDVNYPITENIKIFSSVNYSGRLPSFTDLYYVGPSNIGNINIKPENALNYEIGTKYITNSLLIQTSIYRREGKNIIDWVKLNPDDLWQSNNLTEVISNGFEISAKINFEDFFIKNANFSYAFIDMEKTSNQYISKYVLDYLKHKIILNLNHKIYKNLSLNWNFSYNDRQGTYLPYINGAYQTSENYNAIFLIGAKLYWKSNNYNIYMEASNITDIKYQDIENIELPGRWIKGGIILNFNFNKHLKSL